MTIQKSDPDRSKPLGTEDSSGFEFVKEMLAGDVTYGINFDRIQWDSKHNRYAIIEFLLCDEKQFVNNVTPFTSHPNRYFHKNAQKFISLWKLAQKLEANLFLVNYSHPKTQYADEVLLMKVMDVKADDEKPVKTKDKQLTRKQFSAWLRDLNARGKSSTS